MVMQIKLVVVVVVDTSPFILTHCSLSERYDLNHLGLQSRKKSYVFKLPQRYVMVL